MKKGMALETLVKALMLLAVVVIVLLIFRQHMSAGNSDFSDTQKKVASQKDCWDNPSAEGCLLSGDSGDSDEETT